MSAACSCWVETEFKAEGTAEAGRTTPPLLRSSPTRDNSVGIAALAVVEGSGGSSLLCVRAAWFAWPEVCGLSGCALGGGGGPAGKPAGKPTGEPASESCTEAAGEMAGETAAGRLDGIELDDGGEGGVLGGRRGVGSDSTTRIGAALHSAASLARAASPAAAAVSSAARGGRCVQHRLPSAVPTCTGRSTPHHAATGSSATRRPHCLPPAPARTTHRARLWNCAALA